MTKSFRSLAFIFFVGLLPSFIVAQTNDAGAIGVVDVSTDLGRYMSANVSQELRFNQNLTRFDRSATSLGVDYTLIRKVLKMELGYDLIYQQQTEYYEFKQRVSLGFSVQQKLNAYNFKLRSRVQSTWRDEERGDYKFNPKYVWRNKLECAYTIFGSPVKPFLAGEIFCPLNGSKGFYADAYRFMGGIKYRTSAHTTLEFMLRFDQEIQQANPKRILYGGFGWYYNL